MLRKNCHRITSHYDGWTEAFKDVLSVSNVNRDNIFIMDLTMYLHQVRIRMALVRSNVSTLPWMHIH